MLPLSKDNSTIIKGIAISMMLFIHLFAGNRTELCTNLLYIGNTPFALWLTRACSSVPFFLMLSGYGLAYKYEKNELTPSHQATRILYLYLAHWIVLGFFLILGHYMVPSSYSGSISTIIKNMLGWRSDFSSVMWFLFPYCLVSLFSLYIIKVIDRIGLIWSVIITACIYICTCYLISRHGHLFFTHMWRYQPLLFIHFLFFFTAGVALRRTSINLTWTGPKWIILIGIILIVIAQCIVDFDGASMIYTPLMIIFLGNLHYPKWIKTALIELGKKSMPMWMIHCWLSLYLFKPQFYSLKYPLFIFLGLIVASYLLSIPVLWLTNRIYGLLPIKRRA